MTSLDLPSFCSHLTPCASTLSQQEVVCCFYLKEALNPVSSPWEIKIVAVNSRGQQGEGVWSFGVLPFIYPCPALACNRDEAWREIRFWCTIKWFWQAGENYRPFQSYWTEMEGGKIHQWLKSWSNRFLGFPMKRLLASSDWRGLFLLKAFWGPCQMASFTNTRTSLLLQLFLSILIPGTLQGRFFYCDLHRFMEIPLNSKTRAVHLAKGQ